MKAILLLLLLASGTGLIFLGIFYWAYKSGQFRDLDGPAHRMLHDDDEQEKK